MDSNPPAITTMASLRTARSLENDHDPLALLVAAPTMRCWLHRRCEHLAAAGRLVARSQRTNS